jgi:transposase
MREAKAILELIRERGRKGLPLERVYRLLYNPDLYLMAYGKIYRNAGAMTPGVTKETADGMSMNKIMSIIEALRRQVHTVTLMLDNGTTHAPKQLEGWLREQERGCSGRLHFQVLWLPPNASWLDQIEIWFSVLQRKHLQPNHFLSTKDLEHSLNEYIAYHNQAAKPINWTYTVEKLEQKLGNHL